MYDIEKIKAIIEEAVKTSKSMMEASAKTNMNFKTFFKYAKILGLFTPNPSGKGTKKNKPFTYTTEDILKGLHPQFQTSKLLKRLINENIKKRKCEECNLTDWNNHPIPLELDHIDGNPYNHKLSNLRILCPNCHAQTNTYRGKNKKNISLHISAKSK